MLGALDRGDGVVTRGALVWFGVDAMRGDSVRCGVEMLRGVSEREGEDARGVGKVLSAGVRVMPVREEGDSVRAGGVAIRGLVRSESVRADVSVRDCARDGRLMEPSVERSRVGVRDISPERPEDESLVEPAFCGKDRSVFRVTREKSGRDASCGCRSARVRERIGVRSEVDAAPLDRVSLSVRVVTRSRMDDIRRPASSSRSTIRFQIPPEFSASVLRKVRPLLVRGALAAGELGASDDPLRMLRASRSREPSGLPSSSRSVAVVRSPRRTRLRGSCVALDSTRADRTREPREASSIAVRTLRFPRTEVPASDANRTRFTDDSRRDTRSEAARRVLVPPVNPRMTRCGE